MKKQDFESVDDLAREVIRLGREVAEHARKLHVGGNSKDTAFVNRALEFVRERKPFAEIGEGGLATAQEILNKDIRVEITGSEEVFMPTHFDELGQHDDRRRPTVGLPFWGLKDVCGQREPFAHWNFDVISRDHIRYRLHELAIRSKDLAARDGASQYWPGGLQSCESVHRFALVIR